MRGQSYFDYTENLGRRDHPSWKVVPLDVVDWEPIEVKSRTFESIEDLKAYVAREVTK